MCKTILLFLLIITGIPVFVFAQDGNTVTQLKQKIKHFEQQHNQDKDTAYANALIDLAYIYYPTYPDSALLVLSGNAERCHAAGYKKGETNTYMILGDAYRTKGIYAKALDYYEKSFQLAKSTNDLNTLALNQNRIGMIYLNQSNYPEALSRFYASLKAAEAIQNNNLVGAILNNIGIVQLYQGNFTEAENAYQQRLKMAQEIADTSSISLAYNNIGEVNLQQKNPVKALGNLTIAYNLAQQINDQQMLLPASLSMGEAYYELDSLQRAASLFENGLQLSQQADQGTFICNALIGLAKVRNRQGRLKEALANGLEGLHRAEQMGQVQLMRDANEIVSAIYEAMNDGKEALKYYRAYKLYSDSMNNLASQRAVAIEKAGYEFSKKEVEYERKSLQQRWLTFFAFAGLLVLVIILWIILRNRNRLKHTYNELQHKNAVIETQKSKAEETLFQLKSTQAQLIQSEKMASLGELTAGIAHEIQNPLNFVNNFSELSNELIEELKGEKLKTGSERDEKLEAEILNDIRQNLEKINHHGKRADAIVKGMLQHSRQTKGMKEAIDINALCDEYLRLSYHGLRAKDKNFNADFTTDFDESIGKINIVPQDIGRVLLNLFNNAFYAVNERKKLSEVSYQPSVSVQTKKVDDKIEIIVKDNGSGIPQPFIDKIFQPFFTTKPTGQGTGLGLSLAYDIITKEHGGTLRAESKEGEGSEFLIQIPKSIS